MENHGSYLLIQKRQQRFGDCFIVGVFHFPKKKTKSSPQKRENMGHLQNPTSKMCFFCPNVRLPLWCGGAWVDDFSLLEVGCVSSMEGRTWGWFRCRQPIGLVEVEVLSQIGATSRTGWEGCEKNKVWSWFKVCQLSKSSSF